jgi:hypothetical protein
MGDIKIIRHNTTKKASSWKELNQQAVDKELGAITAHREQGEQEDESGVVAEALAVATVEEPIHHHNKHRLLHRNQPM